MLKEKCQRGIAVFTIFQGMRMEKRSAFVVVYVLWLVHLDVYIWSQKKMKGEKDTQKFMR